MLTRSITYTDYLGNERTEEFMFNMNKAELIKWMTTSGDYTLDKKLQRLIDERNGKQTIEIFESLIELSYGKISLDGRTFEKGDDIFKSFKYTEAYSILFSELISDAQKAADFVNAIIPAELAEAVAKELEAEAKKKNT